MHDSPPSAYHHFVQTPKKSAALLCFAIKQAKIGSIIKFPPNGDKGDKSYDELPCSTIDMAIIHEIITGLAEYSRLTLLFKQGDHLKQLGAQINHVHPLKFLSTIFKDPDLRSHMLTIAEDGLKWTGFLDGLAPNLTKEADKGKLEQHLAAFCTDVGIPPDHIKKYFQNRDWESFVRYLMNYSYD